MLSATFFQFLISYLALAASTGYGKFGGNEYHLFGAYFFIIPPSQQHRLVWGTNHLSHSRGVSPN
jgi:hypothetical protein